jgi:NAD(P)H-dependent FMN reductase
MDPTERHRPLLQVVIASTRPGRLGAPIAHWFRSAAEEHAGFSVELVDLAAMDLPMLDEPKHPRLGQYQHEHTKRWSKVVDRADAFAFVHPEYNHGMNAPLKNALDYLSVEWEYKPVGFVSYGGVASGTRAMQMLKQVTLALRMMPASDAVSVPFASQLVDEDGRFEPSAATVKAAVTMLDELVKLSTTTRSVRKRQGADAHS